MARKGEIQFIQRAANGPLLFDRADLDAWIESSKQ